MREKLRLKLLNSDTKEFGINSDLLKLPLWEERCMNKEIETEFLQKSVVQKMYISCGSEVPTKSNDDY